MRVRIGASFVLVVGFVTAGIFVRSSSRADDVASDPHTVADVASDITDVYAFMKPVAGDAGAASDRIVLVMNVAPHTGTEARFSDKVEYAFLVRRVATTNPVTFEPTDYRVNCVFIDSTPQLMTCDIPGVGKKSVSVGSLDADASAANFALFAGERSNPAFIDRAALLASRDAGTPKFAAMGTNSNDKQNVLSIVAEVPVSAFRLNDAGTATPILAVSGRTTRN